MAPFWPHFLISFKVSLLDESIARCLDDVAGIAFLWFDECVCEVCSSHASIGSCVFQGSGANPLELNSTVSIETIALGQKSQIASYEGFIWFNRFVLLFLHAPSDAFR